MTKKTLVIGASENLERYSNKAMRMLLEYNHPVVAVGKQAGQAYGVAIHADLPSFEELDTITLYLNPMNQKKLYEYILKQKPKRIIFNPGTENPELEEMARAQGIDCLEACTLVLLRSNQF